MEGNRDRDRDRLHEEITVHVSVNSSSQELNIRRYCPISVLKTLIRTPGIAANILQLSISGKRLEDDKLVSDYDIENNSHLDVDLSSGMEVYVRMPNKYIRLHVKNSMTVQDIKVLIQDMEAISCEQQTLILDGNALKDTSTLSACGIIVKSTIYMVLKKNDEIRVMISFPEGYVTEFDVKTWYTIWDLKTIIRSKKQIPHKILNLIYDGERLKDSGTLAGYNVSGKSVLKLRYLMDIRYMQIDFVKWDSNVFSLELCSCDYISDARKELEEKFGFPQGQYALFSNRRIMADGKTLGDYCIGNGSTVNVLQNLRVS